MSLISRLSTQRKFVDTVDFGVGPWDWALYERLEAFIVRKWALFRSRRRVTLRHSAGKVDTASINDARMQLEEIGATPRTLSMEVVLPGLTIRLEVRRMQGGASTRVHISSTDEVKAYGVKGVLEQRRSSGALDAVVYSADDRASTERRRKIMRVVWAVVVSAAGSLVAALVLLVLK